MCILTFCDVYVNAMKFFRSAVYILLYLENPTRIVAVGQEMYEAKVSLKPQPTLIKEQEGDDKTMTQIKSLILDMTQYNPQERITVQDVVQRIQVIQGGNGWYIWL